jgi:hypothetical protein
VVLAERLNDFCGLRFDGGDVFAGYARLAIQINSERAADDDERKQQRENLMSQSGNLIHQFGLSGGIRFRFVHGN